MKNKFAVATLLLLLNFMTLFGQDSLSTQVDGNLNEISNNRGRLRKKIDSVQMILGAVQRDFGTVQGGLWTVKESVDSLVLNIDATTKRIQENTFFGTKEWIGWWVAILSLIVAAITLWAQSKTEKHTQNAPISAQIGQFKDLARHLYRNLVCTSAAIARYTSTSNKLPNRSVSDTKYEAYPSESNFNKLKTLPDDVILDIDVDDRTYEKLHELRVLLRNYNIEIDVASNHISNSVIWNEAIKQDFDNLLFKPLHLVKEAFEPESLLMSADSGLLSLPDRSVMIMIEEHFEKLMSNFNTLGENRAQEYLKTFFGSVQGNAFSNNAIALSAKNGYKSIIDSKDSLWRSLNNLARSGLELYGSNITSKSGKDYLVSISKASFISYLESRDDDICSDIKKLIKYNKWRLFWVRLFATIWPFNRSERRKEVKVLNASLGKLDNQLKARQEKKLVNFIKSLSSIPANDDGYVSFSSLKIVNYEEKQNKNVQYEDLYRSLRPYLTYISQDSWMFNDLLYVMLAVDTSIEVNRIGMVNYE